MVVRHNVTARPGRDRVGDSGYTEGRRPMPTAGEDRDESVYRNPVGAQSGMPLEGQTSGAEDEAQRKAVKARPDVRTGGNQSSTSGKAA